MSPPPEIRDMYLYSKRTGDIMWYLDVCLVTNEVAELLAPHNFSGIEFRPVNLFKTDKCRRRIEGYVEMRVTGRVAIDQRRSGMRLLYKCPLCGSERHSHWSRLLGLHLLGDYEDWPEVFSLEPLSTFHHFAKPRFAQMLVDLKVRPLMLTTFEDFSPLNLDPSEIRLGRERYE